MDPLVTAAMLAASLLHAAWHALVKSSGDRVVALAGMNLVSGALAVMAIPFVGPLPVSLAPVVAASVGLHIGYKIALARLYASADLVRAYPLARGLAPLIAVGLAFALLGELPAPLAATGLALVCAGVLALAREGGRTDRGVLLAALAAGGAVAAYSTLDAYGVRLAGDWIVFTAWLIAADSIAFVGYALATRGKACAAGWASSGGRVLASGLLGSASFGVFMWALGRAPVATVAALRETSTVFAALIGILVLGERATAVRLVAAAAVASGVAMIAASR